MKPNFLFFLCNVYPYRFMVTHHRDTMVIRISPQQQLILITLIPVSYASAAQQVCIYAKFEVSVTL
jgi:hypothetical protein